MRRNAKKPLLSVAAQYHAADQNRAATAGSGPPCKFRPLPDWLVCASFFYPLYWLALFLVNAAPALLRVVFLPYRLAFFDISFFWIQAASRPADVLRAPGQPFWSWTIAIVLAASLLALLVSRRRRLLGGLFIASLGHAAGFQPISQLLFGRRSMPWGPALLFFGVTLFGLLWMTSAKAYRARLATLGAGFLLPAVLFYTRLRFPGAPWRFLLLPALLALAATLVAAAFRMRPGSLAPAFGWRAVAAGLTASVVLASAISICDARLRTARAASLKERLAQVPKVQMPPDYPKLFFQNGVSFTTEGPGGYWPDVTARMLDKLRGYGVNAIALIGYGGARRNEPAIRFSLGWERAELLEATAAVAHQRGIKVMLKPQLWVNDASFPGDIDMRLPEDRARWFDQYRQFVEFYARLAARMHADLLCIGTELVHMSRYEAEWRALIARARELYPGPLVYAATQGPEFEGIRFWDALDYIGLNEYYPLPANLSTADLLPRVESVQKRYQRPVIFTEVGFVSMKSPEKSPWDESARALAPDEQARCYEAIFRAFYRKPWFQGMYWWKIATAGYGGPSDGSFTPWGKPAMEVVGRWYRAPRVVH